MKRILLAEDDRDDQSLFFEFLQNRTDLVLLPAVENGVELISYLEKQPDESLSNLLIILDQNMPKKNGLNTLEFLKETPRFSHIPVMIYSTYTDPESIRKGKELGAALIYSKPLDHNGYQKMIDEFLQHHDQ
jgi:CheY-like chemotaxis protein